MKKEMTLEELELLVKLFGKYLETSGIEDRFLEGTENRLVRKMCQCEGHLVKVLKLRKEKESA